jgi:hypothetical protein
MLFLLLGSYAWNVLYQRIGKYFKYFYASSFHGPSSARSPSVSKLNNRGGEEKLIIANKEKKIPRFAMINFRT